jgi:multidrug efflux pump subunit AcrA (membrane-fusion protein)
MTDELKTFRRLCRLVVSGTPAANRPAPRAMTHAARAMLVALFVGGALSACSRDGAKREEPTDAATPEATLDDEATPTAAAPRVTLSEAAARTARIGVEMPRREQISAVGAGMEVPGQVEFDPSRVAIISPRTGGRLERMLQVPGDRVAAGQVVAYVQSTAYLTAQNDLLQARRRAVLLRGTTDEPGAQALLDAARRRLLLLGASDTLVLRLETSDGATDAWLAVSAPFGGSIIEVSALAGQAVEAGTALYKLADLSTVNVAANIPERVVSSVRIGQYAHVRIAGLSPSAFTGRVTRVADVIDAEMRTATAVIRIANTNRALKPGMFASVTLNTADRETVDALTIPSDAIVLGGTERYVFVEIGPRLYERRAVQLLATATAGTGPLSRRVAVSSGITATDRVVVRGAFTLKSELAKASLMDVD